MNNKIGYEMDRERTREKEVKRCPAFGGVGAQKQDSRQKTLERGKQDHCAFWFIWCFASHLVNEPEIGDRASLLGVMWGNTSQI